MAKVAKESVKKLLEKLYKLSEKKDFDKLAPILKELSKVPTKEISSEDGHQIKKTCSKLLTKLSDDTDAHKYATVLKDKLKSSKSEKSDKTSEKKSKESSSKHSKEKTEAEASTSKKSSSSSKKGSSGSKEPSGLLTQPIPKKNKDGVLVFPDFPDFTPNLTPKEVLKAGSFGGTYFRPIFSSITKKKYGPEVWQELPADWIEGLNVKTQVASPIYDEKVNRYKVKCGGSLQMWEESGWINEQDPYGWFQWYCRFYQGRRTEDDARQVSRWWNCASVNGRWRNNLISKIFKSNAKFNDPKISPVVRQTLLHWGYDLTEEDYKKRAKKLSK